MTANKSKTCWLILLVLPIGLGGCFARTTQTTAANQDVNDLIQLPPREKPASPTSHWRIGGYPANASSKLQKPAMNSTQSARIDFPAAAERDGKLEAVVLHDTPVPKVTRIYADRPPVAPATINLPPAPSISNTSEYSPPPVPMAPETSMELAVLPKNELPSPQERMVQSARTSNTPSEIILVGAEERPPTPPAIPPGRTKPAQEETELPPAPPSMPATTSNSNLADLPPPAPVHQQLQSLPESPPQAPEIKPTSALPKLPPTSPVPPSTEQQSTVQSVSSSDTPAIEIIRKPPVATAKNKETTQKKQSAPAPGPPVPTEQTQEPPPLLSAKPLPINGLRPVSTGTPGEEAGDLNKLHQLAAESYATIDAYIVRFRRREKVGSVNMPEELMLFKFRKKPFSVYFKWLGGDGIGREVVYVDGQFGNKLHTKVAAGDVPLIPAGRVMSFSPDSPLVRAKSRHSITDAGIGNMISKFGTLVENMKRKDYRFGTLKYLGLVKRPEFENPVEAVLQIIPPKVEKSLPGGGKRFWYFDTKLRFPVLVVTLDAAQQEVEYYCYDRWLFPGRISEDEFNPNVLWKK